MKRTRIDEESLSCEFPAGERQRSGIYYTPSSVVELVLQRASGLLPRHGQLAVIDPACGAGAFLAGAAHRLPRALLFGLELSAAAADRCRNRLPAATVLTGDALRGGLTPLLSRVPRPAFELWVGNPPYNGTSPLLLDKRRYAEARALLPDGISLPRGTSLRDDYAFFLLLAARRLSGRPGALAFVTSATLLDSFLYAPLRRALLSSLELQEVIELGGGAFSGTRVRTCVTLWRSPTGGSHPATYRTRRIEGPFEAKQLGVASSFTPRPPDWHLRPADAEAEALDRAWREAGEPLSVLVPISLPGLKTRFDELLVDVDPARLLERVDSFLRTREEQLADFAQAHGIPERCLPKLLALKASADCPARAERRLIRPFLRDAGAGHRRRLPLEARAFCYLDRHLIPRGDHRLRGRYDPHRCPVKLVFNTRERPLAAALIEEPGCVHAYRHTRFAPLQVPRLLREAGLWATRGEAQLGPEVPNLSARGLAWAEQLGGPLGAFRAIADFINSPQVQGIWAPALAASHELWVPLPPASSPTRVGKETSRGPIRAPALESTAPLRVLDSR